MRVAFLSVSSQVGGSEVVLLQVIRELRASEPLWDLHLIVPAEGPLAARARALGAAVSIVAMPMSLLRLGERVGVAHRRLALAAGVLRAALGVPTYSRRLRRVLSHIGADVLHTNGFKAHIMGAMARGFGAALVWHMHEYVSARPVTRAFVRWYAHRCAAIIAVSDSVAADVRLVAGDGVLVQVIHNAVDLERFAPSGPVADLDALAGLETAPCNAVRVGLVATFSRWKGHEVFLRAMTALPLEPPVRGYVIGGPLYDTKGSQHSRAGLTSLASELGLDDRVGFTGFVQAPDEAIRALDVVVHASTDREAFGLVIAEAMACGRAVVTSGTGGSAELVRDGEDALVHRAGDAAHLASRIALLVQDAPLRQRIGAAARDTATHRFDAHRLAAQFSAVYHSAATGRAAGSASSRPGSRGAI